MRSKFKKALAVLASAAMCGSMLLYFPDGTFDIDLTAHAAEGDVAINETNFPDETFRNYVSENFDKADGEGNKDNFLSAEEISDAKSIDVFDMSISDLKGVEYFTALTDLLCQSNQLTSLDVSKNMALTTLDCYSNQLTSLDVSKNTALTHLDCSNNQLTSLDVSKNTALAYLVCYSNRLLAVNAATDITFYYNASPMTAFAADSMVLRLADYGIDYTMMSSLTGCKLSKDNQYLLLTGTDGTARYVYDVDGDVAARTLTASIIFSASGVAIDETNFPDKVFRTYVDDKFDTTDDDTLDADEIAMVTKIDVYDMGISDLKGVEYFTALTYLNCYFNQLTSLDVRKNTALTDLDCYSNQLTSLDVTNNTALTYLDCGFNQLTSLDITNNTALKVPLCDSNTYKINLTGNTFDLSTLPEGFDVKKASEWTNATIEGNTLTVTDPTQKVTYIYDLGNGSTATFTLKIDSAELTKDMVQKIEAQTYTGEAITPVVLICGDYTLVEGTDYTIKYADNTNAGTASYTITGARIFTGELTGKFEIVKATPDYEIPTGLKATYGDILADVELPEGWAWVNNTQPVGTVGTNSFDAVFTPADTTNYNTVTELVDITVGKATPKVTPIIPDGEYTEGDALPKIGFESVTDGVIEWITKLVDGLIEGENELEWQFTPDDTDNYEVVTGTEIVEAKATTTTTTTTTAQPTTTSTTTTTQPATASTTTTTQPTTTSITTTTQLTTTSITTTTQPTTTSTTTATQPTTTSTTTTTTTSTDTTTSTTETTTTTTHIASATTTQPTTTSTTTTTVPTTTSTTTTTQSTATSTTETTTTTTHIASTTTTQPTTTSTTTTTTTSTDTTTSTTETTTTTTHIASDEELCEWAVKDYEGKTGVTPANAEIEYTADDTAVITLTDAEGNVLDVYTIDPTTGTGTDSDGGEVNLPQTGYSVVYNYIMLAAAAMVFFGIFAMAKSRKRDEE